MKIEWKRKFASRKFWSLIAGFIAALLLAFNLNENMIAQVVAVVGSFGLIAVYILAEAGIDKVAAGAEKNE